MATLISIADFVITTLMQLYITLVMLRFLLQWVRADFYNPLSQFIVKVTNPLVRPLRRIIPGWGGLDMATLLLAYLLTVVQIALVGTHISPYEIPGALNGQTLQPLSIAGLALLDLITLAIGIYLIAIIVQAVVSWVNPGHHNPVMGLIHRLTEPLLRPARRLIPPISGIDLSPLLVLLALQVVKMLLVGLFLG